MPTVHLAQRQLRELRTVGRKFRLQQAQVVSRLGARVVRLVVDVAGARRAEEAAVAVLHQLVFDAVRRQRQGVRRVERNREGQHDGIGRERHEPLAQPDDVIEPGLDRVAQEEDGQCGQRHGNAEHLQHRVRLPDVGEHFGRIREVVVRDDVEARVELLEEEVFRRGQVDQSRDRRGSGAVQDHAVGSRPEPAIRHQQDVERERREQVQALDQVVDEARRQDIRQPGGADIGLDSEPGPQEGPACQAEHQVDGHDGQPRRKASQGLRIEGIWLKSLKKCGQPHLPRGGLGHDVASRRINRRAGIGRSASGRPGRCRL